MRLPSVRKFEAKSFTAERLTDIDQDIYDFANLVCLFSPEAGF